MPYNIPNNSFIFSTDTPETHLHIHNLSSEKKKNNPELKPQQSIHEPNSWLFLHQSAHVPLSTHLASTRGEHPCKRGRWESLQEPEWISALTLHLDISWQVAKVTNHSCDAVSETSWHFRENLPYEILCMSLWWVVQQMEKDMHNFPQGGVPRNTGDLGVLWLASYPLCPGLSEPQIKQHLVQFNTGSRINY